MLKSLLLLFFCTVCTEYRFHSILLYYHRSADSYRNADKYTIFSPLENAVAEIPLSSKHISNLIIVHLPLRIPDYNLFSDFFDSFPFFLIFD